MRSPPPVDFFKAKSKNLKARYGIDYDGYRMMLANQGDRCGCCEESLDPADGHVDHCHSTGVIRGIVCQGCNLSLGHAKDDPVRLRRLADYIERQNSH